MAFGDQIYRQTKITTSQCHECKTPFIKMPLTCRPPFYRKRCTKDAQKTHKTRRQSLFSAIESSMNGGAL
ncbi:hypothetical protein [Shewanella psychromarinicola]|uniref:hypothetical protein n=1 Tax=Shewanella psychromarinicola TaxID=2487742 RepID=UPI0013E2E8EA|nr:hypothetical protein [Shewanella psychromarinicola]MCL1082462.1 hypothetical protein [Shewanella psychromarinicola]